MIITIFFFDFVFFTVLSSLTILMIYDFYEQVKCPHVFFHYNTTPPKKQSHFRKIIEFVAGLIAEHMTLCAPQNFSDREMDSGKRDMR